MKLKAFSISELLLYFVAISLVVLMIVPIIFGIVDYNKGKKRTKSANYILNIATNFYKDSKKENIIYPAEGLKFICDGKRCEALIGTPEIGEDGRIVLAEEKPISYMLQVEKNIPSSGSITIYSDGKILPTDLAFDSHICLYDDHKKIFSKC